MSSISGTSSGTSGTLGNVPPVSFPGVSSGIDYNAIIEKYTSVTLAQEKPAIAQITKYNAQNVAILRITSLLGAVQDSLTGLSNPAAFNAYRAAVSPAAGGSAAATATQVAGQTPIPGTYVINAQTIATSTTIVNNPSVNGSLDGTVPLERAGVAIIATNGSAANGSVAVNGVRINYDVSTQTIGSIVAALDSALASSNGGSAVLNADGTVTLTGVLTLGSGGDSGNLLHVLKLDTAQLAGGVVTSSSTIAGLNAYSVLNVNGNAGFATAVTAGSFTINGVAFTVDPTTDTLAAILARINGSSTGVVAGYNAETSALTLTNKTSGPQSILLGVAADTSNFLTASGLQSGTTIAGTQASLTYTNTQGSHTVYSSTNDVTSAIPGITLELTASSPASLPPGSTFYSVTVAPDSTNAETAIGAFIKAYNAAIVELNKDTVAPTVTVGHSTTANTSTSTERTAGGVLYGNYSISHVRDQLVGLVSGFVPSGSSSYNSLASVGILLDTNAESVGANDADTSTDADASSSSGNAFSVNSTSGQLAALDLTKFRAAYAANTAAISTLFTAAPALKGTAHSSSATAGFAYQLGNLIANTDGLVTFLTGRIVAPADLSSVLLNNVTTGNLAQITSLQRQIDLIDREATQQADSLRAQFTASESHIAQLLALQTQISAIGH